MTTSTGHSLFDMGVVGLTHIVSHVVYSGFCISHIRISLIARSCTFVFQFSISQLHVIQLGHSIKMFYIFSMLKYHVCYTYSWLTTYFLHILLGNIGFDIQYPYHD